MQVDAEFLQNVLSMVDTTIVTKQANRAWRSLAIPHLGADWEEKFLSALNDPEIHAGDEAETANLKHMRSIVAAMLEIVRVYDSIPPNVRVN